MTPNAFEKLDPNLGVKVRARHVNSRSITGLASGQDGSCFHFKQFRDSDRAQREALELCRAAQVTAHVRGAFPARVIDSFSQGPILATEYVPGENLFNYLWNNASPICYRPYDKLSPDEAGRRLGTWLKAYHDSTSTRTGSAEGFVQKSAESGIRRVEAIQRQSPGLLSKDHIQRLIGAFGRFVDNPAVHEDQAIATIHGDLNLSNVLVSNGGNLVLLDFADVRTSLALEDVVRVWHAVAIASYLSKRRSKHLNPFLIEFINAYSAEDASLCQSRIFRLYSWWHSVVQILGGLELVKTRGWFRARLERRLINANCNWLAEDLSQTSTPDP